MKTGDKVRINIREEEREIYCKWLFDGCQSKEGTIEREYPTYLKSSSPDGYEFLVRFDKPIERHWDPIPQTVLWFNHKDLILL